MKLSDFAATRKTLFWYIRDITILSDSAIVEWIVKYGNWKDFLQVLEIIWFENFREIFSRQISQKRVNYHPRTINLFQTYIKNHEHEYIKQ
jgi:hypothetical protein